MYTTGPAGTYTCKPEIGITDHLFNSQIFEIDRLRKFVRNLIQNSSLKFYTDLYIQGMNPSLFTKSGSFSEGAIIRTNVPSTQPRTFGKPTCT